jgi:hypothetical protein
MHALPIRCSIARSDHAMIPVLVLVRWRHSQPELSVDAMGSHGQRNKTHRTRT